MHTDMVLDALDIARWQRGTRLEGLVAHSDARSVHLDPVHTEHLADAGAVTSIGSMCDSYDNALAESTIGLYKTECIHHEGPWRGVDDVELATLNWVCWFNNVRLHSAIGYVPPVEHEQAYYRHNTPQPQPRLGEPALH